MSDEKKEEKAEMTYEEEVEYIKTVFGPRIRSLRDEVQEKLDEHLKENEKK